MNFYIIIRIILSFYLCYFIIIIKSNNITTTLTNKDIDTYMKQHNFIFISGWPQSGTSFILNLLNLHPYISTMIDQCQHLKGDIYIYIYINSLYNLIYISYYIFIMINIKHNIIYKVKNV